MIRDVLIPRIKSEFDRTDIAYGTPPDPIAVFPAAQEAVGKVLIYDHGDEATVYIEKITHTHINPYDASLSGAEREKWIADQVVEFLRALFADKILLHIHNNGRSGGWMSIAGGAPVDLSAHEKYFLWSKPFRL